MPWYQLTYALSDDNGAGPGGWQVQGQAPADMPESVRELLRSQVVTRLLEVVPTDEFASSAELEARARRLVFKPVDDGLAWWHAATAGKDATGTWQRLHPRSRADQLGRCASSDRPVALTRLVGSLRGCGGGPSLHRRVRSPGSP